MKEEKIFVLISTIYANVDSLDLSNFPESNDVFYLISVQCENNKQIRDVASKYKEVRSDVSLYAHVSSGLSVNRNYLLSKVESGIAIIADDDVKYSENTFDIIRSEYQKNDSDYITFMIMTPKNEHREYKNYANKGHRHSALSLMKVSSIEITFDVKKVVGSGVRFDTRFGLGSGDISKHEESIFLNDLRKQGLRGRFSKKYIVCHPYESSGKAKGYQSLEQVKEKFCFFFRYFGFVGVVAGLVLLIKNRSVFKFGTLNLTKALFHGWRYKI
ncbi:hypothetical protein ACVTOH_002769 [Vibrio parahaemolyticus]